MSICGKEETLTLFICPFTFFGGGINEIVFYSGSEATKTRNEYRTGLAKCLASSAFISFFGCAASSQDGCKKSSGKEGSFQNGISVSNLTQAYFHCYFRGMLQC